MAENKKSKIVRAVGFISYLATGFCLGWLLSESKELEEVKIINE